MAPDALLPVWTLGSVQQTRLPIRTVTPRGADDTGHVETF